MELFFYLAYTSLYIILYSTETDKGKVNKEGSSRNAV